MSCVLSPVGAKRQETQREGAAEKAKSGNRDPRASSEDPPLHSLLPIKCFVLIPEAKVPGSCWHIDVIPVAIGMKTRVSGGAFCPLLGV